MPDHDIERDMLREFYRAWLAFHAIPRDRLHRHKHERAAQNLCDASNTLKNFYALHPENGPVRPAPEVVHA